MWHEFTGIVAERAGRDGFVAQCLERPAMRGAGRTADEAMAQLAEQLAETLSGCAVRAMWPSTVVGRSPH